MPARRTKKGRYRRKYGKAKSTRQKSVRRGRTPNGRLANQRAVRGYNRRTGRTVRQSAVRRGRNSRGRLANQRAVRGRVTYGGTRRRRATRLVLAPRRRFSSSGRYN